MVSNHLSSDPHNELPQSDESPEDGSADADVPVYFSLRAFARAIPRAHPTLLSWMHRDDWPDDVPRRGPWTEGDVAALREWAAVTLKPDRTGHHDPDGDDHFWRLRGEHRPLTVPRDERLDCVATRDWRKLPRELVSDLERRVLEGGELTPDQVRDYVGRCVRFRALMVDACADLPAWLTGLGEAEIARRMRGEIYERIAWFRQCDEEGA